MGYSTHSVWDLRPVPCTCGRQFGLGGQPRKVLSAQGLTGLAGPDLAPPCCWRHWWTRSSQLGKGLLTSPGTPPLAETPQDSSWDLTMGSGVRCTETWGREILGYNFLFFLDVHNEWCITLKMFALCWTCTSQLITDFTLYNFCSKWNSVRTQKAKPTSHRFTVFKGKGFKPQK